MDEVTACATPRSSALVDRTSQGSVHSSSELMVDEIPISFLQGAALDGFIKIGAVPERINCDSQALWAAARQNLESFPKVVAEPLMAEKT